MKLQHVHLRIGDAENQQAIPCRIRCTDSHGQYYAPLGRLTDFDWHSFHNVGGNLALAGSGVWAYIDGACEILLPPGEIRIQAVHGLEYEPLDITVAQIPGKLSLRLTMKRWTRREGWCSADTRILHMSPSAALLEARAEDVRVANVLAYQTTARDSNGAERPVLPSLLDFSGQKYALEHEGTGVAVNTWNQAETGSLGLLHCHRVVHPLVIGGDDVDWTLDDLVDQCHRKKGLAVWSDVPHQVEFLRFGEPLLPAILGKINAFEIAGNEATREARLRPWYTLLNAGIPLALVGTGAKHDNTGVIGGLRTMTQTPGETYSSWVDACLFGKTYITNGPLLDFTIDGKTPHTTVRTQATGKGALIMAKAESVIPFETLEIVYNGEVIATTSATTALPFSATVELEKELAVSGWLAARCRGSVGRPDLLGEQTPFAHTSPVYVDTQSGDDSAGLQAAMAELDRELHGLRSWIHANETPSRSRARLRHFHDLVMSRWNERKTELFFGT